MMTPTEVLIEVVEVLNALKIPYLVVGSFASSARGVPRATGDADIVTQISTDDVDAIVEQLSARDFYVDDLAVKRAIALERAFNALHRESMFKVDIYVSRDDFTNQEMERKLAERILPNSDTVVHIATAEDTVVAKLSWFRKGGEVSQQQWIDVLGVLKVKKDQLDYSYMREWSERLRVGDLLDKAIAEAF